MLRTVAVILVLAWALGRATSSPLGGFIHVLVVLAFVLFLIQARRAARARQREAGAARVVCIRQSLHEGRPGRPAVICRATKMP